MGSDLSVPDHCLSFFFGWRSLEQKQSDARLVMLYKIINGHVAIPLPSYFQQPT